MRIVANFYAYFDWSVTAIITSDANVTIPHYRQNFFTMFSIIKSNKITLNDPKE